MAESPNQSPKIRSGRARYAEIRDRIAASLDQSRLEPGLVLTEEQLARIFGTSRTPARRALNELAEEGRLSRFAGRGFLVSPAGRSLEPVRKELTGEMFGLSEHDIEESGLSASVSIERDFENAIIHALPFGRFLVYEQQLADHYQVSRTLVREVMSRLQARGLIKKDPRSHWEFGPLTASEIAQFFAIRGKLEPLALADSAPRHDIRTIEGMWLRLQEAMELGNDLAPEVFSDIETDLHSRLLSKTENGHLLRMVEQSQIAIVVNRLFALIFGTGRFEFALREHATVLEYTLRGSYHMAAEALEDHIRQSAKRTRERLKTISVITEPEFPEYLSRREL